MKIKYDRVVTYHEEVEAEVDGTDPVRSIIDGDFTKFLVVKREEIENKLGDVKQR